LGLNAAQKHVAQKHVAQSFLFGEKGGDESMTGEHFNSERQPGTAIAAAVAQLVEHVLGKDEVIGSSPISSF
tara:strand:+ start:126 stop:341 length:216 start_codon:yes stop_codon:yes gene_type:complete